MFVKVEEMIWTYFLSETARLEKNLIADSLRFLHHPLHPPAASAVCLSPLLVVVSDSV